jgi:hypothetical protein
MFSILISVFWFGHALDYKQWLAVGVVFFALGFEAYHTAQEKLKKKHEADKKKSHTEKSELMGEKSKLIAEKSKISKEKSKKSPEKSKKEPKTPSRVSAKTTSIETLSPRRSTRIQSKQN